MAIFFFFFACALPKCFSATNDPTHPPRLTPSQPLSPKAALAMNNLLILHFTVSRKLSLDKKREEHISKELLVRRELRNNFNNTYMLSLSRFSVALAFGLSVSFLSVSLPLCLFVSSLSLLLSSYLWLPVSLALWLSGSPLVVS